jgi:hypothetical protein
VTPSNPPSARAFAWALALLAVACAALAAAPETRAAQRAETVVCWKRLLNDWYDGRIDNAYPVRCYRQAIANLPDDVKVYADAEADIRRALLAALLENKKATGKQATPATPVKPPEPAQPRTEPDGEQEAAPPTSGPGAGEPPFDGTLPTGATRSADSVPVPLIVLGALAMLLLAAAGAGVVARRLQARRIPGAAPPTEEPPPVA